MAPLKQQVALLDVDALDQRLTALDAKLDALLAARNEPAPVLLDRAALARALDLSTKSLDKLRTEPGFPMLWVGDVPRFELNLVLDWLRGRGAGLRLVGGSK